MAPDIDDDAPPVREELLKLVEEDDGVDTLDETSLKRMILNFDKKVLKNQELRVKFPDQPEKYLLHSHYYFIT